MVLNRIHTRIKVTSRQNNNEQFCWFVIPEVILGAPKYDAPSCIVYVVNELKENGFKVKYTHPNLLLFLGNTIFLVMLEVNSKSKQVRILMGLVMKLRRKTKKKKILLVDY